MNECPIEQFFVLVMKTFLGQLKGFTVSEKYCSYACFTANPLEPRFSHFGLTLLTKILPKSMSAKDLYIAQQNSTLRKVFGNPFSLWHPCYITGKAHKKPKNWLWFSFIQFHNMVVQFLKHCKTTLNTIVSNETHNLHG